MDTKSRKYNRAMITGILIAGLAATLFVMLFPLFERRAAQHQKAHQKEWFESTEFIQALIKCNYIFYKNVRDKSGNKIYSYEELYMDKTVEELETDIDRDRSVNDSYGVTDAEQENSIITLYIGQIMDEMESVKEMYADGFEKSLDYYVLDKNTGASIKNTSLAIEELLKSNEYDEEIGSETSDEHNSEIAGTQDIDEAYAYYVIMDYDKLGNLQNIYVKGPDADKLFKLVRSIESSSNGRLLHNRYETETFALYDENTERVTKLLTLTQKKPENAVFIYAITDEQMQAFNNSIYMGADLLIYNYPTVNYYYNVGVDSAFILLLAAIFTISVVLAVLKPNMLEGMKDRKMPVEVILTAGFIFVGFGVEMAMDFVAYMILESRDAIPWADYIMSEVIKYAVSFFAMALVFGLWYYLCLELSDIVHGIKDFISRRSLIYIFLKKTCAYVMNSYTSLKSEIQNADLGKDMNRLLKKLVFINFFILLLILIFWGFGIPMLIIYSFALYFIIKKYISKINMQYKNLLDAVGSIADGNLNNTFEEDFGVFESSKEKLYEIQNGFKNAVDKEVKSQMMKTELITNVSHDLKTPLTAIITYIDLMKDENITEEQRREYLNTLERKSQRLKVLIEDLFEMSRATSGNINLEQIPVDICSLMRQAYLEHEDKMEQAGLQVRFIMPEEKIILKLDSQKTYRIFENLYGNIVKYAMPETRVFITAEKKKISGEIRNDGVNDGKGSDKARNDLVHIEIKNISEQEIIGDPQHLSERFVRGDVSRNTEGSGLGLAIARSFTELQGGIFRIESDGDLFKVILEFDCIS